MADDPGRPIPSHLRALFGDEPLGAAARAFADRSFGGLRTSRVTRALSVGRFALSGGGRLAIGKAKQLLGDGPALAGEDAVRLAESMLDTFSELRGLAMKVGQMMSYVDDGLPPEVRKLLALLQRDAPPMPYATVRGILEAELGERLAELCEVDEAPLAAASIGQVHRGRLRDGTEVAIKVQYPGIDKAMRSDLSNARAASLFKQLLFVNTDLKAVMSELEERFLDECDYTREAAYQEAFHRRFVGHPTIAVPRPRRELSTARVLVTELERGRSFYEWIAANPSAEARRVAARTFYRFYLGSFYLDGLFNCDPHPGNYLFRDDGKIVFLDYGCCRHFTDARRQAWIDMALAVKADDPDWIHRQALTVGFFRPDVDYDRAAFRELMRWLYEPYLLDEEYDFSRHRPLTTFRTMFTENPNLFRLNMPADAVFLNRITFGLVSLQAQIGAPLNCHRQAEAYFARRDPDWGHDPHLAAPFAFAPG